MSEKLGPSGVQELNQFAASGGKPSDPSVLKDASFAFSSSFAVMMIVFAVLVAVCGVIAWWMLKRYQHADPPGASDAHPQNLPAS